MTRGRARLDVASALGVPIGVGLILAGQWIEGGSLRSLLQGTAALIVFGGTLGAVLFSFPAGSVWHACGAAYRSFIDSGPRSEAVIDQLIEFSVQSRKRGIVALETEIDGIADPFLRKGLMLAVDGTNPRTVRQILEIDSRMREEEDEEPARVFEAAAGYSPTLGILGAVLGLIHVMENLAEPAKLGSGIAVAFVATIYGVGAANLLLLPLSTKLHGRARRASQRRELILEGVLSIQEGLNPRLIEQKLRGFVSAAADRPMAKAA